MPSAKRRLIGAHAQTGLSSGILGESHSAGAGSVVGLDVDERDQAAIDLPLGAVQSRADFVGALDIFAAAAERSGHLVEARIAEIAAGLVALRVGGSAAVEADHHEDRNIVGAQRCGHRLGSRPGDDVDCLRPPDVILHRQVFTRN
jgi:hypothetical protein